MVRMNDSQDPFEQDDCVAVESNGRREQITPLTFVEIMTSFNERMMKYYKYHNHINATIIDSLTDITQKWKCRSNASQYHQEENSVRRKSKRYTHKRSPSLPRRSHSHTPRKT